MKQLKLPFKYYISDPLEVFFLFKEMGFFPLHNNQRGKRIVIQYMNKSQIYFTHDIKMYCFEDYYREEDQKFRPAIVCSKDQLPSGLIWRRGLKWRRE